MSGGFVRSRWRRHNVNFGVTKGYGVSPRDTPTHCGASEPRAVGLVVRTCGYRPQLASPLREEYRPPWLRETVPRVAGRTGRKPLGPRVGTRPGCTIHMPRPYEANTSDQARGRPLLPAGQQPSTASLGKRWSARKCLLDKGLHRVFRPRMRPANGLHVESQVVFKRLPRGE